MIEWAYIFELIEAAHKLLITLTLVAGLAALMVSLRRLKQLANTNFQANQGYTLEGTVMTFLMGVYLIYFIFIIQGWGEGVLNANGLAYIKEPTEDSDYELAIAAVRRLIQFIGTCAMYKGAMHARAIGDNGLKHPNQNEGSPWSKFIGFTLAGLLCIYHDLVLEGLQEITPFNPFEAISI